MVTSPHPFRMFWGTMTTLTNHTTSTDAHTCTSQPATARKPRPSVAERRQADLAEGIIKLSPSSLTFLHDECPACFWHHYNGRPRPATAFPKVCSVRSITRRKNCSSVAQPKK